jgi:biotin carboxyl carrier protein
MYKVKINDHLNLEITEDKNQFIVDGEQIALDIQPLINDDTSNVIYNNKSYNVEVVAVDEVAKISTVKVNGNLYKVQVEDQFDLLLKKLGMDTAAGTKIREIKAPMPGMVLKVMVEEGTEVKKGDNLLVLEAMKMENILKSSTDGIVKKVLVMQGDKIEKNTVLVQFQ